MGLRDAASPQARVVMEAISYQHISSYFESFSNSDGALEDFATMKAIHRLVLFDRKYQTLLMEYIGLFELKFRAQLSYSLTLERGPFAHRNPKNFLDRGHYEKFLEDYGREFNRQLRGNKAIKAAYDAYGDAPTWLAVEIMSFGTLSKLFRNTKSKTVRKEVAASFGCSVEQLVSWTMTLNGVRNTCAHFNRLCGVPLSPKPKRLDGVGVPNDSPFYPVLLLAFLLRGFPAFEDDPSLAYGKHVVMDAIGLLHKYRDVLAVAGFPDDWTEQLVSEPVLGEKVKLVKGGTSSPVRAVTRTADGKMLEIEAE